MINFRLIFYFHLLWIGVLAALTLLLSLRFPYPETNRWFRITLMLLAASAAAAAPLFSASTAGVLWLPLLTFVVATIAFVVFSVQVIRTHYRRLRR